jgi:hypothetical protein
MNELDIEQERREFLELYAKIKSENIGELHAMGGWEWWLAAKRSMQGSAEPVAFAFVIVDKNGNPEFVTSTHDEAQAHINDAISEHNIHGAGKWRSIPAYEMRPSDDKLWDQTLRERDYNAEIADKLAGAISKYFDEEIGEHSSANCPWLEALRVIEEAAPPAPISAEPVIPEGFALVPIEPTAAMLLAGQQEDRDYSYRNLGPENGVHCADCYDHYKAMLKAAPAPPSTDAKDSERFDWYFGPDSVKFLDFMAQYLKGMHERWSPDQWRTAIDAAIAAKES